MKQIIDLHIHSKYARATSKYFELAEIAKWSAIKGVDIVACGDFTHPAWFKELKNNLVEVNNSGLYNLRDSQTKVKFILATEIACIYRQNDKTRRVHLCILMPSLEAVEKFNQVLTSYGAKLASDGRPILGMSAKRVLELMLQVDERALMIPAHIWTPWFAVFGSKSGFDSLTECFEDLTPHIKVVETGLSSDPQMNWQLSQLNDITLVSNSDAHSGPNIGREANVLDLAEISYDEIVNILKNKDKKKFLYTIEFFPENGMYHFDGHRACAFSCAPAETKKLKNICPKCHKALTIGVANRVESLADLKIDQLDLSQHIPYKSIMPLPDLIADYFGTTSASKKVQSIFLDIIQKAGNEFRVLLDLDLTELQKLMPENLAQGIIKMRANQVQLIPGFDGQYGKVEIFSDKEQLKAKNNYQKSLF